MLCAGTFAQTPQKTKVVVTSPTQSVVLPERVELSDLEGTPENRNKERSKPYLKELLKLRDKEGRDNALIHYTVASWAVPNDPARNHVLNSAVAMVVENGWGPQTEIIAPLLEQYQPALAEMRRGTALNYAKGIGCTNGWKTPVPNFFALKRTTQMLCVEGRYFESQKQYAKALENYLNVLTVGADCSGIENPMVGNEMAMSVQEQALKSLSGVMVNGHLGQGDLEKISARLKQIQKAMPSLRQMVEADGVYHKNGFVQLAQKVKEGVEIAQRENRDPNDVLKEIFKEDLGREETMPPATWQNLDKVGEDYDTLQKLYLQFAETPFWNRNLSAKSGGEFKQLIDALKGLHPLISVQMVDQQVIVVGYYRWLARIHAVQIEAELELLRLEKGRYLENEMFPAHFDTLAIDPFSGNPFGYSVAPNGQGYTLFSVGPSKGAGDVSVSYDSTNGSMSAGRLFFSKK